MWLRNILFKYQYCSDVTYQQHVTLRYVHISPASEAKALCPILDKKKNFAPFFWGAISSILNQGQTRLEATGGPRGASQPL